MSLYDKSGGATAGVLTSAGGVYINNTNGTGVLHAKTIAADAIKINKAPNKYVQYSLIVLDLNDTGAKRHDRVLFRKQGFKELTQEQTIRDVVLMQDSVEILQAVNKVGLDLSDVTVVVNNEKEWPVK